ncbi:TlpA family protein disulfide reductase [Marinomonas sp. A79]|uniref:TlpA family protein disulfide reductase n=1 Tax=Marinomonas vulgaris TaxID=2823372 RepID=A0ABS5HF64_9GAMM|nr:TlpA disulfide reductase family protein [Marinomonas vulgaris]MBR7890104.1 TlpA family protein disulfide reductase [Marinomonas vulgaris]
MVIKTRLITAAALCCGLLFSVAASASRLIPIEEAKNTPHASLPLPQYQGGTLSLQSVNDQVLLVDFWASWCGPCRESFPWMSDIQAKYKTQGLKVIAINLDQDKNQALNFLKKYPPGFTVLFDNKAAMPDRFGVIGMPTSYLVDREGRIRAVHTGFHQDQLGNYEQLITQLLAENKD